MIAERTLLGARTRGSAVAVLLVLLAEVSVAGDREQAERLYREANGLYDQGRFAEAAAEYARAIDQDAKFVEAYHNRALANEMVDRRKAIEDWKRFLELAAASPDLKWDVGQVKARLQILEGIPSLPEVLQPGRYVESAGDYYRRIAGTSEGEQWRQFPVKVYLGNAPQIKWQQGVREAYNIWSGIAPMELVAFPERADVRFGWEESVQEEVHAGEESDWVRVRRSGDQMTGRRFAVIAVDLSFPWSKDEMRAIALHEFGHALGIKGHSESSKDLMFWKLQESGRRIPGVASPYVWRSLVKQPSQRDINTLIRLYNSAGTMSRFQ